MKEKGKKMSQNSPEERGKESSTEKGWEPSDVHDQRSLDIGKSGQFAPGLLQSTRCDSTQTN